VFQRASKAYTPVLGRPSLPATAGGVHAGTSSSKIFRDRSGLIELAPVLALATNSEARAGPALALALLAIGRVLTHFAPDT